MLKILWYKFANDIHYQNSQAQITKNVEIIGVHQPADLILEALGQQGTKGL